MFQITPSDEIIRTIHLPQFGGVYFDLKNQYKILFDAVKKKIREFMMPIKTYNKIETIVLYFFVEKNLEISFQNGPEHETTSLNAFHDVYLIVHYDTSAMKLFLTSVSLQHEPKASDVITLFKKTFFRTSIVRNCISRGVKMRISAREACVKPHLRTRSDIKIFNVFDQN